MFHSLVDCVQRSNAYLPISVMDDWIKIARRLVHPWNAPGPILSSPSRSRTVVDWEQYSNARE